MDDELFLNEQIKVITVFGEGLNPCRPIKFKRANCREITVTEIGLRHPSMQGKRMLHIFDVTDGQARSSWGWLVLMASNYFTLHVPLGNLFPINSSQPAGTLPKSEEFGEDGEGLILQ